MRFSFLRMALMMVLTVLLGIGCTDDEKKDLDEGKTSVENAATPPEGVETVDLGLSVKWATFNVGATKPEEFGDYYAWGDVETKMNYYNGYYIYDHLYYQPELAPSGRDGYTMNNKYYYDEDGGYTVLDPEDDVAHVKWGGSWRMPTKEEIEELKENCTWIWTTENGADGFRVTSKKSGSSDASIFLPAARGISDRVRGKGNYWSASLSRDYNEAIYMYFNDDCRIDSVACFAGLSIRPVCP